MMNRIVLSLFLLNCFGKLYSQIEVSFLYNKDASAILLKIENSSSVNYFLSHFDPTISVTIYKKCGRQYLVGNPKYDRNYFEKWAEFVSKQNPDSLCHFDEPIFLKDSVIMAKFDSLRNMLVDSLHNIGENMDTLISRALYQQVNRNLMDGEEIVMAFITDQCGYGAFQLRIEAHATKYFLVSPTRLLTKGKYKFVFDYIELNKIFRYPPFEISNPERLFGYKRYNGDIITRPFYVKVPRPKNVKIL